MTDGEAVQAVVAGDRDRYRCLVDRYQRMVYGIAWSRLGDADLCEEAAQETFVKAYRYLRALRDPERFGGWLVRIARNVTISVLRRHMREIDLRQRWQLLQPATQAIAEREDRSRAETLGQALAALPETHRESLVLYYVEGRSVQEAASTLGIAESAMKTRLHRARHALRDVLEQQIEESLASLGPGAGFTAGIMPLLPALPLGAATGGASLLAKIGGGLVASELWSVLAFLWLGPMLFLGSFALGMAALQTANLAPGTGQSARQKLIWRNAAVACAVMGSALLFSVVSIAVNPSIIPVVVVAVSALTILGSRNYLRVGANPFALGQQLFLLLLGVSIAAVCFFQAPVYLIWLAFGLSAIVQLFTAGYAPTRQDYNLFLRHELGMLGEPPEQETLERQPARRELKAFARFLGSRNLICGVSESQSNISFLLPPVKASSLGLLHRLSRVTFHPDARCEASVSDRDWRGLNRLMEKPVTERETLELRVGRVVTAALRAFLASDHAAAERLLQREPDASIYLQPRLMTWVFRALAVVGILCLACAFFFGDSFTPRSRVVSITKTSSPVSRVYGAVRGLSPEQHGEIILFPGKESGHRFYLWDYTPKVLEETKSYAVRTREAPSGAFSFEGVPAGEYFVMLLPATAQDIPAFRALRDNDVQVQVNRGAVVEVEIRPVRDADHATAGSSTRPSGK